MPSSKHTKIEITPVAYKALEAEAILQGKTLKKLASDMILRGVSKKALDFIQETPPSDEDGFEVSDERMAKVIEKIGTTRISIDKSFLEAIQKTLREEGYQEAMLYISQRTASIQRDELHRVLTLCERYNLPTSLAAEIIRNLNKIEAGIE